MYVSTTMLVKFTFPQTSRIMLPMSVQLVEISTWRIENVKLR